jgi:pimeloyl-ACP methyl ester carboxylesterase
VIWYGAGDTAAATSSPPFSIAGQAAGAQALLVALIELRVVGHWGASIATELALQAPGLVRSLVELEPAIFPPPLVESFLSLLEPALETYRAGDVGGAVDGFMKLVGPAADWRAELTPALPDGPTRADRDAHVTFDVDLTQIVHWVFDAERAKQLACPVAYFWARAALYDTLRIASCPGAAGRGRRAPRRRPLDEHPEPGARRGRDREVPGASRLTDPSPHASQRPRRPARIRVCSRPRATRRPG